jgi:hypothetical protein
MTPPVPDNPGDVEHDRLLETRLSQAAAALRYPPTPDIARAVGARLSTLRQERPTRRLFRLSPALLALVALALTIGAVGALRLGAVTLLLTEPEKESEIEGPKTATPSGHTGAAALSTITPTPSALLSLAGRTTLADARRQADFPILLPTYPSDLGNPDMVFYQELGGQILVHVWLADDDPNRVVMSLHALGPGTFALKGLADEVEEASVNDTPALWTTGPYVLVYTGGGGENPDFRHLVEGHVLIWQEDDITYRLETTLPLQEAIRVAESLQ